MRELYTLRKELQHLAVLPPPVTTTTTTTGKPTTSAVTTTRTAASDDTTVDDDNAALPSSSPSSPLTTTTQSLVERSRFDILTSAEHRSKMRARTRNSASDAQTTRPLSSASMSAAAQTYAQAASAAKTEADDEDNGNNNTSSTTATAHVSLPVVEAVDAGVPCHIAARAPHTRLQRQPFAYLLVCDFEATCAADSVNYPHEIIEFPVVVLDTATLCVVCEFHAFVRPVRRPQLTRFCTELTGITQADVDAADTLPDVLTRFTTWLHEVLYPMCRRWRQRHLGNNNNSKATSSCTGLSAKQRHYPTDTRTAEARQWQAEERAVCFATDGPWDMRHFMHECGVVRDGVDFAPLFYRYINVRHCYSALMRQRPTKLTTMLRRLRMTFEGRRHSGRDDARNIARVLAELLARGYRVHTLSTIPYKPPVLTCRVLDSDGDSACDEDKDEKQQQQHSNKSTTMTSTATAATTKKARQTSNSNSSRQSDEDKQQRAATTTTPTTRAADVAQAT